MLSFTKPMNAKMASFLTVDELSPSGIRWSKTSRSDTNKPGVNQVKPGSIAGCLNKNGFWRVEFQQSHFQTHRVVVYLMTGIDPVGYEVDHIDGNRSNNTIDNLRIVTSSMNSRNKKRRTDNSSGRTGVYWISNVNKWRVNITVEGKTIELGRFECFAQACQVRDDAEKIHDFHENHDRYAE